jgi:hypothetical protein
MSLSPESLLLLQPFTEVFTRPTFCHMRTLVYGTRLSSGRRTVAAALRAMWRGEERHFTTYHRVLNRAAWSPFQPPPHSAWTPGDGVPDRLLPP